MIEISKTFRFEASHVLPKHPGKCSRLHGHSWVLTVTVEGHVDPETGFVCDYADLSKVVNENIIDIVDHRHLGQGHVTTGQFGFPLTHMAILGSDFYPSSENLVKAFARILSPLVPGYDRGVRLKRLTLNETCTSAATWVREQDANAA